MSDAYNQKLDQHSYVSRLDPLRDAAERLVEEWDDGGYATVKFRLALEDLRKVLGSVKR